MKNKLRIIILLLLVVATALFIGMPNGQKVSELTCQNYTPNFSKPGEACCSFNLNEYQSASDICKQEVEPIELELNPKNQISLSINNALDSQQQLEIELVNKKAHKQYLIYARNLIAAGGIPAEKIEALPGMIFNSAYQNPSPQWYLLAMVKAQKTKKGAIQFVLSHAGKTYKAKKRKKKLNLKIQTLVAEPGTQEFLIYALKKKGAVPDKAYFFAGTPPVFEDYDQDGDGYCRIGTEPAACTLTPGDCDDNNAEVYRELVLYPDADADNYTALGANICIGKTLPANYFIQEQERDCDDANPQILGKKSYYIDKDGDGYGEDASLLLSCESQVGYVDKGGDPNDNDPSIFPGTDNDDDTDGVINRLDCAPQDKLKWKNHSAYLDSDNDNYTTGEILTVCSNNEFPTGYKVSKAISQTADDCAPQDSTRWGNMSAYADADKDNYTTGLVQSICSGSALPVGYKTNKSTTDDCAPADATKYRNGNFKVDADGDTYGIGNATSECYGANIPLGKTANITAIDCNDTNKAIWQNLAAYADTDNDGITAGAQVQVCSGVSLPSGYKASASASPDCAASDNTKWQNLSYSFRDTDGDNFYIASTGNLCSGATLPSGYKASNTATIDCNDSNSSVWQNLSGYPDVDNDGRTSAVSQIVCTGATLPANLKASASSPADCNDVSASIWQNITAYADADGDGVTAGSQQQVCSGANLPMGYKASASVNPDCAATDKTKWQLLPGYLDSDADNYTTGDKSNVCSGETLPSNYRAVKLLDQSGDDCAPSDKLKWRSYTVYLDEDSDNYTTGSAVAVCSNNTFPVNYKLTKPVEQLADDCAPTDKLKWRNYSYNYIDKDGDYLFIPSNGSVCSDDKLPDKYRVTFAGQIDANDNLAWEPGNANALCLFNSSSSRSKEICDYYNLKRPGSYQFGIALTSVMLPPGDSSLEYMGHKEFIANISIPLKNWILANPDKLITHIAVAKDIPFRLWFPPTQRMGGETQSRSASFYLEYPDAQKDTDYGILLDSIKKKYCLNNEPCKHFHPQVFADDNNQYLMRHVVSWLNAYDIADVKALIDRAQFANINLNNNLWILDGDSDNFSIDLNDRNIFSRVSDFSASSTGSKISLDSSNNRPLSTNIPVAGYFGAGNYHAGYGDGNWVFNPGNFNFTVAARSLFSSVESYNAYSFNGIPFPYSARTVVPKNHGKLADAFTPSAFGGVQYSRAFAGAVGNVDEPLKGLVNNYSRLIVNYQRGLTFAEAAFISSNLNWMNIAVGDPLMRFKDTSNFEILSAGQLCASDSQCASNYCRLDLFNKKRCAVSADKPCPDGGVNALNPYTANFSFEEIGKSSAINFGYCVSSKHRKACTASGWTDEAPPSSLHTCGMSSGTTLEGIWVKQIQECSTSANCMLGYSCETAPNSTQKYCYPESACKSSSQGDFITNYTTYCYDSNSIAQCNNGIINNSFRECQGSCMPGGRCSEDQSLIYAYPGQYTPLVLNAITPNLKIDETLDLSNLQEFMLYLYMPEDNKFKSARRFTLDGTNYIFEKNSYSPGATAYYSSDEDITRKIKFKNNNPIITAPAYLISTTGKNIHLNCPSGTKASSILAAVKKDGLNCTSLSPLLYSNTLSNGKLSKLVYTEGTSVPIGKIITDFDIRPYEAYYLECDLGSEVLWQSRCS